MSIRATGPGIIGVDRRQREPENMDWFFLENFDVNGTSLKAEHRNYLTRRFGEREVLQGSGGFNFSLPVDNGWVFLRGYASRAGNDRLNQRLSADRVSHVRDFLVSRGYVPANRITGLEHVGENWSSGEIEEDAAFRSVEVIRRVQNIPPPPSAPDFIYDRYRLRVMSPGQIALDQIVEEIGERIPLPAGLGATVFQLQIQNRDTRAARNFLYYGGSVSAGLGTPNIEDGHYGPWSNFRTRSRHHVALSEFEGDASVGSLGTAQLGSVDFGSNFLEFHSPNFTNLSGDNWALVEPRTITFSGPPAIGLGFSLAAIPLFGRMVMI